ncbi:MAG: hypothetical protein ABL998_18650, partial [Planctomycetota bacterium]
MKNVSIPAALLAGLLASAPAMAQTAAAKPAAQVTAPEQKKLDELVVRFKKHQADCMEQYGKATTDEER